MKNTFLLLSLIFSMAALAQSEKPVNPIEIKAIEPTEPYCIIPPKEVSELKISECWAMTRELELHQQIKQPTLINEQANGTMPLSKDLPFVHTLRGVTYTYEYLRYAPR